MTEQYSFWDEMEWPTRYPQTPGHRQTDTSIEAAEVMSVTAESLRGQCLDALERFGPMTADEVADRLGLSILTIRPRITELKMMGKVEDTGQRRENLSGRRAMVVRRLV